MAEEKEGFTVPIDVNKVLNLTQKVFDLLHRRTKDPINAYLAVLLASAFMEDQMKFKREEFSPLIEKLRSEWSKLEDEALD